MTQYDISHLDIPCFVKRFVHIYFIIVYVELKSLKAIVFVCIKSQNHRWGVQPTFEYMNVSIAKMKRVGLLFLLHTPYASGNQK